MPYEQCGEAFASVPKCSRGDWRGCSRRRTRRIWDAGSAGGSRGRAIKAARIHSGTNAPHHVTDLPPRRVGVVRWNAAGRRPHCRLPGRKCAQPLAGLLRGGRSRKPLTAKACPLVCRNGAGFGVCWGDSAVMAWLRIVHMCNSRQKIRGLVAQMSFASLVQKRITLKCLRCGKYQRVVAFDEPSPRWR